MSLYCPIIRFLVDQNKTNKRLVWQECMATQTSALRPVCCKSTTKIFYVVQKGVKVTPFSMACWVEGTRAPQPHVRRLPRLDGPRWQAPERQSGRAGSGPVGARRATRHYGRY